MTFPDDSLQSATDPWWTRVEKYDLRRGRLLMACVPYIDQQPMQLTPEARTDARDHGSALFSLGPYDANAPKPKPKLPVAALPSIQDGVQLVFRAKRRPVVVLRAPCAPIDASLRVGAAKYQTHPTIQVAPYFGIERNGIRAGWSPTFVERIRRCEYPQYVWDQLPIAGSADGSVLRLDQAQPLGHTASAYQMTDHVLTDDALQIIDEWTDWLRCGAVRKDSVLDTFRQLVATL